VCKRSFLGVLRVHYEGIRSMMPQSEHFFFVMLLVWDYIIGMML
jgi:hypothetical protein